MTLGAILVYYWLPIWHLFNLPDCKLILTDQESFSTANHLEIHLFIDTSKPYICLNSVYLSAIRAS